MLNIITEKCITLITTRPLNKIEFVLYPPLGLLYVLESFKREGWKVSFINGQLLSSADYENMISEISDPFIGISTTITEIKEALRLAKTIKEQDANKIIIFGGPGISALNENNSQDIDIIVKGEAENFPPVLERLSSALITNYGSRKIKNSPILIECKPPNDLDAIPFPKRTLLPLESYLDNWKKQTGLSVTSIITSRGCPYNCIFCNKNVSGTNIRMRSPKNIADEMDFLDKNYILDEIVITDDFFCHNRERVIEICKEITKKNLQSSWIAQTRVDRIDLEMIKIMKRSGCSQLNFGVESGSNKILKYLKKGFTSNDVEKAFSLCEQAGMNAGMCLIVGIPGETISDIEETKIIVRKCRPYELGVSYLIPFPGTPIYEATKQWIGCDDYSLWDRKKLVYNFKFEIDPIKAREDIFSIFFEMVAQGMKCSPAQMTLDY